MNKSSNKKMEEEKVDRMLSQLSKIEKQEAPPFLYTRITAAIENESEVRKINWLWGIGMAAVVAINFAVIAFSFKSKQVNSESTYSITTTYSEYQWYE